MFGLSKKEKLEKALYKAVIVTPLLGYDVGDEAGFALGSENTIGFLKRARSEYYEDSKLIRHVISKVFSSLGGEKLVIYGPSYLEQILKLKESDRNVLKWYEISYKLAVGIPKETENVKYFLATLAEKVVQPTGGPKADEIIQKAEGVLKIDRRIDALKRGLAGLL